MNRERPSLLIPLLLSAGLFGIRELLRRQDFGKDVLDWAMFAAFVPLIFFVVRFVDRVVFDWAMSRRRQVKAPLLLREIVSIVLFFVLIGTALTRILDAPLTGWLTTGTVVAAILGLALQETLGNLFAGIALHLEDSFEVGDVIRSGDFIGVVESSRWRATRIRTFNNDLVLLPNSLLARERVEVFPRSNLNARILSVGVDYNVPPATVISVLTQAMTNIEGISHDIEPIARVASFGDSSVVYDVKYFMRDYSKRDRIDADIRRAIWYALRRNGISIPFPIRSFHTYQPPARADHDIAPQELLGRLHDVDILSPLSDEALDAISQAARVHMFSKGETILRRGTVGDSMFIVHRGSVSVRIPDPDSTGAQEVAQLGAGSVFGEMALLTGETRTADVVAASDVHIIEIAKDAVAPVLRDHPDLAKAISSKVMERRGRLDSLQSEEEEHEERTILSRIRSYFGI